MAGRFITFEGGEGVGKSTQIRRLAERLEEASIEVVVTREPGGTPGAEAMRHVLLSGAAKTLGPAAEAMLFAAARLDHVERLIRPALGRGAWVLCDRFTDSTRVYQGAGGVDPAIIRSLEYIATDGLRPDLTIVLDAPPEVGLERARKRAGAIGPDRASALDRFERDELDVHGVRRSAFLAIARAEPERCVVIDTTDSPERSAAAVLQAVESRLGPLKGPSRNEEEGEEQRAFATIDAALSAIRKAK